MKREPALLMTRTDFHVQQLDIPPVPDREVEGLIRYKLRSLYPGNPEETAFDYRIFRTGGGRGATRRAVVFVSRKDMVDGYRSRAGRRPLALPCTLLMAKVPRKGEFRAWVFDSSWAEHILFKDGAPVSFILKKYGRGRKFNPAREDAALAPEIAIGAPLYVAPEDALAACPLPEGARTLAVETLSRTLLKADGLFREAARSPAASPRFRLAALSVSVVVLGMLVLLKYVAAVETRAEEMHARTLSLERSGQNVLGLQKEIEGLKAERDRLVERTPRDAYLLMSDLYRILGENVRIRSLTLQDDGFQVDATGSNALPLMEEFKGHGEFTDIKLAQVVPEAGSGRERFTFSGKFHGR